MLYLCDLADTAFAKGIDILRLDFHAMIAKISTLPDRMGCDEFIVFGNSKAGPPALRTGLTLNAVRTAAFSSRATARDHVLNPKLSAEERLERLRLESR